MFRTDRSDYEVFVGYAHAWGSGVNIASSVQKSENTNTELLQVYNRMPIGEGVGFQASMSRFERDDQSSYVFSPYVQYNAPYGIYTLDAQVQSGTGDPPDRYRLSAAGSLVYVGGMFGAARPVNDSFTIVLLDDLRDVDVSVNNERIGSTDARGRLVVPSMKSYYHNQISIDADNIPFEYSLGSVHTKVAPSAWSGSCYSFDAQRLRALTGVLVLASAGEDAVAEFASVTLSVLGREVMFETGAGGEFYVENRVSAPAARDRVTSLDCASIVRQREEGRTIPAGTYPAVLSYQGKRCEFDLTFPDTDDVMTDVGTIRCSP
jgi:outer membrane usher protein FimD/PapC